MPAGLGFMVHAIFGMMGFQSLLQVGALSVIFFVIVLSNLNICFIKYLLYLKKIIAVYLLYMFFDNDKTVYI